MSSGRDSLGGLGFPVPGQQFAEPGDRLIVDPVRRHRHAEGYLLGCVPAETYRIASVSRRKLTDSVGILAIRSRHDAS